MKNKKVVFVIVLFLFGIAAATGWLLLKSRKVSAQELYELAQINRQQGKVSEAKKLLYEAEQKSIEGPKLVWTIATYEAETGNSGQAQKYAQKAWELGKHDKECFLALVHNSGLPTVDLQVEYGRRLLKSIDEGLLKIELEADMHFALKEYEIAIGLYKNLYDKNPNKTMAVKVAYVLSSMDKGEEAIAYLEAAENKSGLDSQGYSLLVSLNFLLKRFDELEEAFSRASRTNITGSDFFYRQAFIYTMLDKPQASLKVLEVSLAKSIKEMTESRILYAYNAYTLGKSGIIEQLLTDAKKTDSPEAEGEGQFYEMLLSLGKNGQLETLDLVVVNRELGRASRLLAGNFIVGMLNAKVATRLGKYDVALDFYENKPDALSKNWSRVILDNVYALQGNRDFKEAVKLLELYHQSYGQASYESLSLLRDLYISERLYEQAFKVQALLEESFPSEFSLKLIRGLLYIESGQLEKARKYLLKLYEDVPSTHRLALEETLAKVYLQLDEPAQALELVGKRNSLSAYKAQALGALRRYDEAEAIYLQEYQRIKTSKSAKQLVFFLISQLKKAEALVIMNEASELEDTEAWIALAKATLSLAGRDVSEAAKFLEVAKQDKTLRLHIMYLESELFFAQGRIFQALDNLNTLGVFTPKDFRVPLLKARSYLVQNNGAEALKAIRQSLDLKPESSLVKLVYSQALWKMKEYSKALAVSIKLIEEGKHVELALKVALESYISLKRFEEALDLVEGLKGIKENQRWLLRADVLSAQGKVEEAVELLQKIRDKDGVQFKILKIKAQANRDLGGFHNQQLTVGQWLELAAIFVNLAKYKDASQCYEKVLVSEPQNSALMNNLAWCLYKSGYSEKAESIARKAYSLASRNNEIVHTLARILIQNQKYKDCENLLSPIIARTQTDVRHHYSLAEVHEKLGNRQEALYQYKQSLQKSSMQDWKLPISKSFLSEKISSLESE